MGSKILGEEYFGYLDGKTLVESWRTGADKSGQVWTAPVSRVIFIGGELTDNWQTGADSSTPVSGHLIGKGLADN